MNANFFNGSRVSVIYVFFINFFLRKIKGGNLVGEFPKPKEGSIFYRDEKLYACLAFHRNHVSGRTIVAWKTQVEDLNQLSKEDYEHLMNVIYVVRQALMDAYNTDKVYVAYLDEANHVHWHLFPRRKDGIEGFELMCQEEDTPESDYKKVPLLHALVKTRMISKQ